MRSRSAGIPRASVYLVAPSSSARWPAARMGSAQGKSGSPTSKWTTRWPARSRLWPLPVLPPPERVGFASIDLRTGLDPRGSIFRSMSYESKNLDRLIWPTLSASGSLRALFSSGTVLGKGRRSALWQPRRRQRARKAKAKKASAKRKSKEKALKPTRRRQKPKRRPPRPQRPRKRLQSQIEICG